MPRLWRSNIILTLLVCGSSYAAWGQEVDSLWRELKQAKDSSLRFGLLCELSSNYVYNQPDSALLLLQAASALRSAEISPRQLALYHRRRALAYKLQSVYDEALISIDSSLLLFRKVGDSTEVAKALVNKGTYYQQLDQLDLALDCFQQGRKLLEEAESEDLAMAKVLNNISVIYISWGMHAEAIALLFEAINIKERLEDYGSLANSYGTLASLYMAREDPKQALGYHQKALEAAEQSGNRYLEAVFLFNIGSNYKDLRAYERAETYMREARVIAIDINNSYLLGYCAVGLAEVAKETGELEAARQQLEQSLALDAIDNSAYMRSNVYLQLAEIAMEQGGLPGAERLDLEGLALAQQTQELPFVSQGEALLAKIYERQGQAKEALLHYKAFKSAQDSILSQRNTERINKLQAQYDHQLEQKDYALQLAEAEKQRDRAANQAQRWYALFVTLGLLVLAAIVAVLLYLNQKQRHSQEELNSMNEELYQSNEHLERAYLNTVSNKQQLELANQKLEHFVHLVSDGLKGQISHITMSAEHLRALVRESQLPAAVELPLMQISENSLRCKRLINDLVRYYQLEVECPKTDNKISPTAIAKEVSTQCVSKDNYPDATVTIAPDLPAMGMSPAHLRELMDTLINGMLSQYSAEETPHIEIGQYDSIAEPVLFVQGKGIVMTEAHREAIFQPLPLNPNQEQLHSGLELAISQRIVALYGGKIWVESLQPESTQFSFTIPQTSSVPSSVLTAPEKENL